MSVNQPSVTAELLACFFLDCTSQNVDKIRDAEKNLVQATQNVNFLSALLEFLTLKSPAVCVSLHQMAAIYLKNHVKQFWDLPETTSLFTSNDRVLLKSQILKLCLAYAEEPSVYSQLSTVVKLIATVDFPEEWPSLLPTLVEICQSSSIVNYTSSTVSLEIMDHVLQKYRKENRSNDILKQLKFDILPSIQEFIILHFTQLIQQLLTYSPSGTTNSHDVFLRQLYSCISIILSLICIDLPEFIETNQENLFKGCNIFLKYQIPLERNTLGGTSHTTNAGIVEKIKTEICFFLTTYALRYSEEFEPFCSLCTSEILDLLVTMTSKASQNHTYDELMIAAIKYLSAIARYDWTPCVISNPPQRLGDICHFLVLPNLEQRDEDIELMTENAQEFIRRNVEDSETDTCRGAAIELVNALMQRFETQVLTFLTSYVQNLLKASNDNVSENLQRQRLKDAAIHLVLALVIKSQSQIYGVSQIRQCIDICDFFKQVVAEILVTPECQSIKNTLVRCSTFKFIIKLRNQLDKNILIQIIPQVIKNLSLPDPVIYCHAALCLEALLLARDVASLQEATRSTVNVSCCPLKFSSTELSSVLMSALDSLLQLCQKNPRVDTNEYIMRTVMRILDFLQERASVALPTFKIFCDILRTQCENPSNPMFIHYLFESLAICTKVAASAGLHHEAEQLLLELLWSIISEPDHDFTPYALQMLALLLDTATAYSDLYVRIIDHLLETGLWSSNARVLAILRVFSALFHKQPLFKDILELRLETFMLRFEYCLNHKRLCFASFDFLNDILTNFPMQSFTNYIEPLIITLLRRLNVGKTTKLSRCIIFSLSLLTCRCPMVFLPDVLNKIKPNLADDFLNNIFFMPGDPSDTLYVKKVRLLAVAKMCTTQTVMYNSNLLQKAIDLCAHLMGAVTDKDIERTQTLSSDNCLNMSNTLVFKPVDEYQCSFHILRCAQLPITFKEIPEVSSPEILTTIKQCFDSIKLANTAPECSSWKQVIEFLSKF
ncbi:exportin-2-like isoform X1 [Hylaeus volcanicus]|uniref:exportin-2-like isoform X1 n=1 Tax=Hylaeus volcanicus TaxID=313075 RepID=UPI0023B791C0|nr:exportin-2-like isoform X1 [Hylaeus volcanicus]